MGMTFGKAVNTCFRKYCGFTGRASRSEFWYFFLFNLIVGMAFSVAIVACMVPKIMGGTTVISPDMSPFELLKLCGPIYVVYLLWSLAMFLPILAVSFRRLHDIGRSGWWIVGCYLLSVVMAVVLALVARSPMLVTLLTILFYLAILAYGITLLVFFCTDSQPGSNKYGPNPKEEPAVVDVVFDAPAAEEPVAEAPAAEETVVEEPAAEEPAAEEPAAEEPVQPADEGPAAPEE